MMVLSCSGISLVESPILRISGGSWDRGIVLPMQLDVRKVLAKNDRGCSEAFSLCPQMFLLSNIQKAFYCGHAGRQPRRRRLVCSLFRLLWILCNVDPILSRASLSRIKELGGHLIGINRAAMLGPILDPWYTRRQFLCACTCWRGSATRSPFSTTKKSRTFNNFTT